MEKTASVFLSHTWADKPFARRLARDLESLGVRVWLDEAEMMIGDSLTQKVGSAIDEMDYLAVVLSPVSVGSEWVTREVAIAMDQELAGKRVKVLPLLYRDCALPPFLRDKLYADFRSEALYEGSLNALSRRFGLEHDSPSLFQQDSLSPVQPQWDRQENTDLGRNKGNRGSGRMIDAAKLVLFSMLITLASTMLISWILREETQVGLKTSITEVAADRLEISVRAGETLTRIAMRCFGYLVAAEARSHICESNGLSDCNSIQAGQILLIDPVIVGYPRLSTCEEGKRLP